MHGLKKDITYVCFLVGEKAEKNQTLERMDIVSVTSMNDDISIEPPGNDSKVGLEFSGCSKFPTGERDGRINFRLCCAI